ncbi:MAG: glycine--tRNA ligase subunit beta [Porticoccaceae bacterium]
MSRDFLVELGAEELPPKSLKALMDAFRTGIASGLQAGGLAHGAIRGFASPRRLAVLVTGLAEQQPDSTIERLGPPVAAAFDKSGMPTPAALGFARNCAVGIAQLEQVPGDKGGSRLAYRSISPGQPTPALLPGIVEAALKTLPIARRMRWGARREEFVRPVHWLVMLFGEDVVAGQVLGLIAGRHSRGHRFHCPEPVVIPAPAAYVEALRKAYVLVDFAERQERIRVQGTTAAHAAGGRAVIEQTLLDEVTALNEWPVPLVGRFEERFLEVPPEALISSMTEHQKYFPVVDDNGVLMPLFIATANIESTDPAQIIAGNERVIRPRLADAAFFYHTDRRVSLTARREKLKAVVFQEKLGTLFDKTERVAQLAEYLAPLAGAEIIQARRAAELSKSDLVSAMVLEFADLQGIMGCYYALNDGESQAVADAVREQYLPRFAGDRIPATATGAVLALADRFDTLVGIFGIGQPPSGSKDPFGLRRASLGILRILVERRIDLDLREILALAARLHPALSVNGGLAEQVLTYLTDRFRAWSEDENIATDVFLAVAAKRLGNPHDIHRRVQAVNAFSLLPEAAALAAANRRVANILGKQERGAPSQTVDPGLLREPAEIALADAVGDMARQVRPLLDGGDYTQALKCLAALRDPVDAFFDQVMVMAEKAAVRANRLAVLQQLRDLFLEVADISLLAAKTVG